MGRISGADKYENLLTSKAERGLDHAINVLVGGAQPVHRLFIASKDITVGDALFEKMDNMCPLLYVEDYFIRFTDPYVGSNRNESAPLSASYVTMVIQSGTSFVNFSEKMYKGEVIKEIDVARLHEIDNKISPSYEVKYGNCRLVYASEVLMDNVWIGALILEIGSVNKIHKPVDLLSKITGNKVASHNFLDGKAK